VWRYLYREVDEHGQVIDVLVSVCRDFAAARRFFVRMLAVQEDPEEVTTDRVPALAAVMAALLPAAVHDTEQYANNGMECDHWRLKARLRPMRGLKTLRSARTIIAGHAFIQNLRRGHYEFGLEAGTAVWASQPPSAKLPQLSDRPGWTAVQPRRHDSQRNRAAVRTVESSRTGPGLRAVGTIRGRGRKHPPRPEVLHQLY
jgi:DDE domain